MGSSSSTAGLGAESTTTAETSGGSTPAASSSSSSSSSTPAPTPTFCVAGKYRAQSFANHCVDCPLGAWSPPGSVSSSQCTCKEGYSFSNGTCEQCAPGSFKPTVSNTDCTKCPVGTYGLKWNAHDLRSCLPCQARSSTRGLEGQNSQESCRCFEQFYLAVSRAQSKKSEYECRSCPVGAICGKDRTCALRHSDMKCTDGTSITGSWEVTDAATGIFKLKSCPSGYEARTEDLVASAELQMCHQCLPKWQYILDPANHSCQECPPGLVCHGDDTLEPVTPSSRWERQGSFFKLVSCPPGYQVFSGEQGFSAELQKCVPCGRGQDCNRTSCIRCTDCRPGFYKASVGTEPCEPCPADSFRETERTSDVSICTRCPIHSSTAGRVGQASHTACQCKPAFYAVAPMGRNANQTLQCRPCPVGALCSGGKECALQDSSFRCSDGSNVTGDWKISEDGQLLLASCPVGFQVRTTESGLLSEPDLQECIPCPASTYSLRPQDKCRACSVGLICHGKNNVEITMPNSIWEIDEGTYRLRSCPPGTLLINSTLDQQQCKPCGARTYSLDDTYGCIRGTCFERTCLQCPQGADCLEDSTFVSKIEGTEWQDVYEGGTLFRRIAKCPAGHTMIRGSDPANDHCTACSTGKYTLVGATVHANTTCLSCPHGAECWGGRIESIQPGYWMLRLQVVDGYEVMNDAKCTLPGRVCAILSADSLDPTASKQKKMQCIDVPSIGLQCARKAEAQESHRRSGKYFSGPADVFICPHGACGANNICLRNRDGPVCGICKPGFAMTSTGCSENKCPSHDELSRSRLRAIGIASLVTGVLLITLSWRPILVHITAPSLSALAGPTCCSVHSSVERIFLLMRENNFIHYFKIYISYFQVVGSFCHFRLDWPPMVRHLLIWIQMVFHFDVASMPTLSCLGNGISFLTRLGVYAIGPFLVATILLAPVSAASMMRLPENAPATWNRTLDLFWTNLTTFLFLCYPVLCVATLQTFDCDPQLGLLKADYRQVCPSLGSFLGIFAALISITYSIGIPIFYLLVLEKLQVRVLVHSKTSNAQISAMLDTYWNEVMFGEIQQVASLVAIVDDCDAKMFLQTCRTLFDELLQVQGGSTFLKIGMLTEWSELCKSPEAANLRVLANFIQKFHLAADEQMDFHRFHNLLSDAHLAVKFYANVFPEAETSCLAGENWLLRLSEAQLDALLFHDWQAELLQAETEDVFALQCQLDEFSEARESGCDKLESLEAATSEEASRCMVQDHGALVFNLQELELNGAAEWPTDWLSEFTLAENLFIKHVKGLKGFQWRTVVRKMNREDKLSTLLTIGKALVETGSMVVMPQVWQSDIPEDRCFENSTKEQQLCRRMGFILGSFRVQLWWWQAMEDMHKAVMIALLRFIYPDSPVPLISGCLFTFGFLVLNVTVQPYCSDGLNSLQRMALLSQFLMLFLGIIISIGDHLPGNHNAALVDSNAISCVAILLHTTTLLWPLMQMSTVKYTLKKCRSWYRIFFRLIHRYEKKQQRLKQQRLSENRSDQRGKQGADRGALVAASVLCNVLQTTAAEIDDTKPENCQVLPNDEHLQSVALPCRTERGAPTTPGTCSHMQSIHVTLLPHKPISYEPTTDQRQTEPCDESSKTVEDVESSLKKSTVHFSFSRSDVEATKHAITKVSTWMHRCKEDLSKDSFSSQHPNSDMQLERTGPKPAFPGEE